MIIDVLLPKKFTARALFAQINESFGQFETLPSKVIFDFGNLRFVRPCGVVFLSNVTKFLERNGCAVSFEKMDITNEAIRFLDDSLFFQQHIGKKLDERSKPRKTTRRLVEVLHTESHDWTRNTFIPWLSECAQIEAHDLSELATCLSELFNNIDDHTELDVGSVFAQWYPKEERVIVAVADFGVGIPVTVARVCEGLTDNEAIEKAFELEFTARSTPRNRGIGLHFLLENVVKNLSGRLEVNSANGSVIFQKDGDFFKVVPYTKDGYCPGTLIVLEFGTSGIEKTEGKLEDFQW